MTDPHELPKRPPRIALRDGWPLFLRFLPYLKREKALAFTILALLAFAIPAGVISPLLIQQVFDVALKNNDVEYLVRLGITILSLTLTAHALRWIAATFGVRMKNRIRERVARDLFEHVIRIPLRFFHKTETGYVMARLREDVAALDALMADNLIQAAVDGARAVLFFVLLLRIDFGLALSGLSLLAVICVGVLLFTGPLRRRAEEARESDALYSSALHQSLTGLFTVRVSAMEARESTRFFGVLARAVESIVKRDRLHMLVAYTIGLAVAIGSYLILTVGAWRILHGTSTIGSLFAFSIYLTYVAGAVTALMSLNPAIQAALTSWQRILDLFDQPAESFEPHDVEPAPIRGRVTFDAVSFRYGADAERAALSGIDVDVEPGAIVALVGRSGAGKSTLVHLIPRLFDPTAGTVRIDGADVRRWPLQALRRQIGVVPQDVFLFDRSIRENIAYAAPDATEDEIVAAATAAHADEFIRRLPQGYDTLVGERGIKLSGGEKQRVAIAREILRDPPILILDEATSSLDSESEAKIKDALDNLKHDRTCFVIAHRLSTVIGADRILVLDKGRIVEQGTHDELLAQDGLYRRLYSTQFADAFAIE